MSDFEDRLKKLEQARDQQDEEMIAIRQEQSAIRQEQSAIRQEIQRMRMEIQVVREGTAHQVQRELARVWLAVSQELQGILNPNQLAHVRALGFGQTLPISS